MKAEAYYKNVLQNIEKAVGNKTTDNFLLDRIGFKLIPNYKGTFSYDKRPKLNDNESMIINVDDSRSPHHVTQWRIDC